MKEAIQYHIFKQVQDNPEITQRELAAKTGISLGKVNYCLQALVNKGFIKATNFKNSKKKSAYLYKLTPQGLEEKAKLTVRFLKYKMDEYDRIKAEIEELKKEVQGSRAEGPNENSLGSEPNGHSRRQANVF
ncbi:MarR family EPS-associated transcriptional regulator [Desulfonatronovibrio magnus]|uniref:MarR family EPS-associated transcriptional regulator n=1 Tax=Desulfonatronovibrio magnus TaxID=698827 RepID=UPI000A0717CF|nr:MarR family EPS-associated transcriptional regulator [Desulfonatronovibrio magnus]